jgi:CRISPR-associated protein Csd2
MSTPIQNRYDFVYFFDVTGGNPNGDPDAGNLPRIDPETNQGLVTDVCLKRKIRNYVCLTKGDEPPKKDEPGHEIFVKEKSVLNQQIARAYETSEEVKAGVAAWENWKKDKKKNSKPERHYEDLAQDWMCYNFFDIRTFGAVMSTGDEKDSESGESKLRKRAGQVRGPLQLTFARSIDPVVSAEFAITRCAVTNEKDIDKERTMGRKFNVPYGLYRCHGFLNASLAEKTGFTEDDLTLLKQALNLMFETDRSAARGLMAPVRCIAFRHDCKLGNARADELFAQVTAKLRPELKAENRPARSRSDYEIEFTGNLPEGVTVEEWVPSFPAA